MFLPHRSFEHLGMVGSLTPNQSLVKANSNYLWVVKMNNRSRGNPERGGIVDLRCKIHKSQRGERFSALMERKARNRVSNLAHGDFGLDLCRAKDQHWLREDPTRHTGVVGTWP